jgi:hypothetical protein
LLSSQNFRTSESYHQVNQNLQPALFGRSLQWNFRALVGSTPYSGLAELSNIVTSAALEVATTLVVDGGVAGYYKVTRDITGPIMDAEPGAKGFFVAPTIEDPQAQMVLINWTSVDVSTSGKVPSKSSSIAREAELTMIPYLGTPQRFREHAGLSGLYSGVGTVLC